MKKMNKGWILIGLSFLLALPGFFLFPDAIGLISAGYLGLVGIVGIFGLLMILDQNENLTSSN